MVRMSQKSAFSTLVALSFVAVLGLRPQAVYAAYVITSDIEQRLNRSLLTAEANKLTYLPGFIKEKMSVCPLLPEAEKCFKELAAHSEIILQCPDSRERFDQGIEYDDVYSKETFLTNPIAEIPATLLKNFKKLEEAVRDQLNLKFPLKLKLAAYKSKVRNAHAALNGNVYMSEGLWTGEDRLTEEEITAVLAHEVTHVIHLHGMKLNCMAIEWTDPNMDVLTAQKAFQEDFQGSYRFQKWSALSVSLEYDADKGATTILKKAGFDPLLMSQALKKLKPKTSGGFSSGSHPDFDARIQAAVDEARKL